MGLKVALIHDWLNGMRGGEKVFEVFCEIYPQADVYTLFYEPDKMSETIRAMKVQTCPFDRLPALQKRYRSLLPLLPWMIGRFDLRGYDLVLSSSSCVAKSAKAPRGIPNICYCHSPMRYVWDLYDTYRQSAGLVTRAAMSLLRGPLQRWDAGTADRVTHYIANSRNIADKIQRFYGREAAVIHPPVDCDFYQQSTADSSSTSGDYFFICSAMVPYKRLDLAIEACHRLGRRLVIAGKGPERERLEALAAPYQEIEFTQGWISDERLRDLYANARAFLFPGEEDFGIAPIEAMACGRPVIAYARGGALETVVDGKTGFYFHSQTIDGMIEAIQRFEKMSFEANVIRAHAESFGRRRFRNEMSDFIETALNQYT